MPGLIDKAIISGSDNPERYLKRVDRNKWVKGGYCIQATPFELAQTISAIRSHSAPKSMLCVGVDSAGTERFMAEELGIMSIRFTEESGHPAFAGNCEALQECGVRKAECKTFDLVTVSGESAMVAFEAVKPFLRDGSVVAVFDTGVDAMQPECRLLWHTHRKSQTVILHTHEQGVGVFMVKNMTAMGVENVPNMDARNTTVGATSQSEARRPDDSAQPASDEPRPTDTPEYLGRVPEILPEKAPEAPPKRRGRPPKVRV